MNRKLNIFAAALIFTVGFSSIVFSVWFAFFALFGWRYVSGGGQ